MSDKRKGGPDCRNRDRRWIEDVYTPWYNAQAAALSGNNGSPPPPPGDGD